jgi:hypothetical protein
MYEKRLFGSLALRNTIYSSNTNDLSQIKGPEWLYGGEKKEKDREREEEEGRVG